MLLVMFSSYKVTLTVSFEMNVFEMKNDPEMQYLPPVQTESLSPSAFL